MALEEAYRQSVWTGRSKLKVMWGQPPSAVQASKARQGFPCGIHGHRPRAGGASLRRTAQDGCPHMVSAQAVLLLSTAHMRAAAILGPGCSPKNLRPFQIEPNITWHVGLTITTDNCDVILIFGGDGTVHRHLSSLVALDLPMLVVPVGSGNDFARAIGVRRVRDSLKAWQDFCRGAKKVRAIDLGMIQSLETTGQEPKYFCSVVGVGLDAEVTRRANKLPRWLRGHGGYALSLPPALARFAPLPMKISTHDENHLHKSNGWNLRSDQPTMLAAFANTPTYGGGMKIAPHAKLNDGLLDVCVIGGVDPFRLACMFPTVYFGRHLRIREVSSFRTADARVETESPLDVYADGEYVCRTPAEITVQREALRVITL
jgi:diacylglycerol kinase (ATP)